VLKNFYQDEINYSKGIIQELSMIIDDILMNNKSVLNKDPIKNTIAMKEFLFGKETKYTF